MAKDPFDLVPVEFQDAVAGSNKDEILNRIAQVALANVELSNAKELDQDLAEKAEAHKFASEPYREGAKANKQKIAFCKQVLEDKFKE
jgi:hypothetical protein